MYIEKIHCGKFDENLEDVLKRYSKEDVLVMFLDFLRTFKRCFEDALGRSGNDLMTVLKRFDERSIEIF